MIFMLGALSAGLLALLMLPAFWRRALRLTRRRLEMLMPLSMDEVVAERDLLRAEFAADKRRLEQRMEAQAETQAQELAELGRRATEIVGLQNDLAKLREQNEELKKRLSGQGSRPGAVAPAQGMGMATAPTAGDKGKIIEANDELKFAIIELSDDAIAELLGPERQNALPQLEMNVRRTGRQSAAGEFVTRIKLRQAVRGKNFVVADILNDWQQAPVEKGDVVFF